MPIIETVLLILVILILLHQKSRPRERRFCPDNLPPQLQELIEPELRAMKRHTPDLRLTSSEFTALLEQATRRREELLRQCKIDIELTAQENAYEWLAIQPPEVRAALWVRQKARAEAEVERRKVTRCAK